MSIIDRLLGTDDDEDPRPTYVCTGCGKAFDDERERCPDCGSEQVVSPRH
ncbi:hypothetical protein ZOD2009_06619 [Haladaptatus paucihalophilus DX253]|uniref:Small CPxCG-related zinc finger protein n=1 Tax=Haladaptatus paucihalophilus DX253 TaxID=797209 RepID=E7QRA1_HALPU|nr:MULTISPECIES: hypothetical protein [Haladaptatus]EFW92520.1 hypothetical protein ZOD2009_06619 [Haladaptatus paucihalophilus DX253]SHK20410.1 hypothetical protein SAMN05444342_0935 [Haladaptatus paucihalophilus DX253]